MHDFVARSISGHATVEMHQHYSSVSALEVRDGLAKVVSLMDFQRAREQAVSDGSGTEVVMRWGRRLTGAEILVYLRRPAGLTQW